MPGVGERIKIRRIELNWTQDALCTKAGISKGFLSDLENDKRSVSAVNLLDIARALGVSLDFLMTGEASQDQQKKISLPSSLALFAGDEGLSFRQTLMLLDMQKQIVAHRSAKKKDDLEGVDWRIITQGAILMIEKQILVPDRVRRCQLTIGLGSIGGSNANMHQNFPAMRSSCTSY